MHHEIERKYLIRPLSDGFLRAQPGCEVWEIDQTYLLAPLGETHRVRRIVESGTERFRLTVKRRLSELTSEEDEREIARERYESLLAEANPELQTIRKTRYRVPHEGQVAEFDRYPFWSDRMILEIELDSEAEAARVPDWVEVIRDVTADPRYKNVRLAAQVPFDEI